jgi:predicted methyltransferase
MTLEEHLYAFHPVRGFWFTWHVVEELINKSGCFETTLDIGLSDIKVCTYGGNLLVGDIEIKLKDVTPSEDDRVVIYELETGRIYEVLRYTSRGFYKLKSVGARTAPTLEISGIHMHRITGTDPWRDTMAKIRSVRVTSGNIVLDTCTGLGYTAIASVKSNANVVYTFEIDENVLWIAERNPWSSMLSSDRVRIYHGDVTTLVKRLPDDYFTKVIHDPPRFTRSTGDLYSLEFYRELYRVLKRGGMLFHYTGEPRIHRPSILKGIKDRLSRAGFRVLGFDREAMGFVAVKIEWRRSAP